METDKDSPSIQTKKKDNSKNYHPKSLLSIVLKVLCSAIYFA